MIGYKYRSGSGPRSANGDNGYAIVFDTDILFGWTSRLAGTLRM